VDIIEVDIHQSYRKIRGEPLDAVLDDYIV